MSTRGSCAIWGCGEGAAAAWKVRKYSWLFEEDSPGKRGKHFRLRNRLCKGPEWKAGRGKASKTLQLGRRWRWVQISKIWGFGCQGRRLPYKAQGGA